MPSARQPLIPLIPLLLGLALVAAVAPSLPAHAAAAAAVKGSTTAAPKFTLPGRTGGTVALDSLAGRVVLVDFWASWCVPCRKSFPWLNAMRAKYAATDVAIVAINLDKERAAAEAFLAKNPAAFTIAFDPAGKTAEAYHVDAMPSTYVIDRDGTLLVRHLGFDPKQTAEVEAALEEAVEP